MQKLLVLLSFLILSAITAFGQALDLNTLTKLFDGDIRKVAFTIDQNKWINENNDVQAENRIKLTSWRYIGSKLGSPQKTMLKITDPGKRAPKMLIFVTREVKTIDEINRKIQALNLPVKRLDQPIGATYRTYHYNKYQLVVSVMNGGVSVAISGLKNSSNEIKTGDKSADRIKKI